jgi:hypothetical protein
MAAHGNRSFSLFILWPRGHRLIYNHLNEKANGKRTQTRRADKVKILGVDTGRS